MHLKEKVTTIKHIMLAVFSEFFLKVGNSGQMFVFLAAVFSRVMNISLSFPYMDYQSRPPLLWDLPLSHAGI